jgi:hypothetical protein
MLPDENSMINMPKRSENNPPITMVHGTTFLAKNCNKTTKIIDRTDEM